MNNNYCSKCGSKIEQDSANFCPKCGQSLRTLKETVAERTEEPQGSDGFETLDFDKIKEKLKIDVEMDTPKVVTIGEVIQSAKASGPVQEEKSQRKSPDLPKGKDLFKIIAKECSSSREKSAEIE